MRLRKTVSPRWRFVVSRGWTARAESSCVERGDPIGHRCSFNSQASASCVLLRRRSAFRIARRQGCLCATTISGTMCSAAAARNLIGRFQAVAP